MKRDLSRLLRPKTIAVVGGGWSERVVEQCLQMGFAGEIWPVHPKKSEIAGQKCYPSIDALPAAPDATFIGVNRNATVEIVESLAKRGAGGAVCFASGFREVADGSDLQDTLVDIAGDMPILGPNCYGFINYTAGALLWPDQHGGRAVDTGVAIIAQSSNIAINLTMQSRGLPIAYVLTVGNQAQTSLADMIEAVLDDPKVTAIGLHIEGFQDVGPVEAALAKARSLGKPVVALKVGTSEAAQAMTLSHTASLAGSDTLVSAFFDRMNVARVKSLETMIETLKLLHVLGPSPDNTLGSLSCSGGEASLMSDLAEPLGLDLRALTQTEADKVADTLPDMVTISNPLDYHTFTWGDRDSLTQTYGAMLDCGFGLTCLVLDVPHDDRCVDNGSELAILAAIDAAKRTSGRLAFVASIADNMTEQMADRLIAQGIAPLMGMQPALEAAAAAAKIGIGQSHVIAPPLFIETSPQTDGFETLDEWHSKTVLRDIGLPTPDSELVSGADNAVAAAEKIGFPVVLKAVSAELAHKTELGAVALNLKTAQDVQDAATRLEALGAPLLVEKMVPAPVAELILGVSRDSQFGLYLTVGAGGIMVELLKDARVLLLPTSKDAIREALLSLKSAPLLTGFRNSDPADLDAVIEATMALANYAMAQGPALEELDINPLIACASGAFAADALIRNRKQTP
ncbi:MAG: acetate--CoA ligase family protein [Sulfitobacter sp.]